MKERGMIFNSEMVRAILDGRKTQTRRIMKEQPVLNGNFYEVFGSAWSKGMTSIPAVPGHSLSTRCPFGAVGDRIWVRETFQGPLFDYDLMDSYCKDPTPFEKPEFCVYKADGVPAPEFYDADDELHCCWRPSIHMPRWASRILLEITDVRVERLNAISQADAIAEGAPPSHPSIDCVSQEYGFPDFSRSWFGQTWQHIYGEESWDANPWGWVIEFKRVEGGEA